MPKRLTITVPHALGAAEVRRRIDLHMDWAFRRLEAEKIRVEAGDWLGNRRAFSGSGYGQTARVAIQVADDALESRGAGALDGEPVRARHRVGRAPLCRAPPVRRGRLTRDAAVARPRGADRDGDRSVNARGAVVARSRRG